MKIELTYDELADAIENALEKTIKMDWLKQNEHITTNGIVGSIAGDIYTYSEEIQKAIDISLALETLQKYMPEIFEIVMDKINNH